MEEEEEATIDNEMIVDNTKTKHQNVEKIVKTESDDDNQTDSTLTSAVRLKKKRHLMSEKYHQMRQLQIDLKNEEAELMMLKRLFYSQKVAHAAAIASGTATNGINGINQPRPVMKNSNQMQALQSNTGVSNVPPNGGGNNLYNRSIINKKNQQPQPNQTNLVRTNSSSQLLGMKQRESPGPVGSPGGGINFNKMPDSPAAAAAAVLGGINSNNITSIAASILSGQSTAGNLSPSISNLSSNPPVVLSQAQISHLIRKEVEKSVSQIELPNPPVQDIYFLPNVNSNEFLMCLGLEDVVKCVQEHLNNKQMKLEKAAAAEKAKQEAKQDDSKKSENNENSTPTPPPTTQSSSIEITYNYPNMCAQCSTDFTPVWRRDKNGVVLCERCFKLVEMRQIKSEYNAKLKQAFLKAFKDKEILEKQVITHHFINILNLKRSVSTFRMASIF
jgi:hypothetical protein